MGATLLNQGTTLMLVGMGTVFAFLTILVLAILLLSAIATRFAPAAASAEVSDEEIAAITVAITQHTINKAN